MANLTTCIGRSLRLGPGNTTGIRASGRRTQPSIRRKRSQWELPIGEEPCAEGRPRPALTRTRASRSCSKFHATSHVKSSKVCPLPLQRSGPLTESEVGDGLDKNTTAATGQDELLVDERQEEHCIIVIP